MAAIDKNIIGNMALSRLGVSNRVENFDTEDTKNAKALKLWYDYSRLQVLEAYDWNFASVRQTLATHSDDPPSGIWSYRYQYPDTAVNGGFREIVNPLGLTADPVPFSIELSMDGTIQTILTDQEEAIGRFTKDLETTILFSPHFVETLSANIAYHLTFEINSKRAMRADMLNEYRGFLRLAPTFNANESIEKGPRDASWVEARS